jgi:hypothetical protein
MITTSAAKSTLVAAAFAAICVFGEVAGCLVLLVFGIIALVVVRNGIAHKGKVLQSWNVNAFVAWVLCVLVFACVVLLLAPFASLPAVGLALLILSPLFGTWAFVVSSALGGFIGRSG